MLRTNLHSIDFKKTICLGGNIIHMPIAQLIIPGRGLHKISHIGPMAEIYFIDTWNMHYMTRGHVPSVSEIFPRSWAMYRQSCGEPCLGPRDGINKIF